MREIHDSRVKKYDLDKFINPKIKEGTQFTNECEIETLKCINTLCEKIYDLTIYESLEVLEDFIRDLENDEIPELSVKSQNNWTEIIDDKFQVNYGNFRFLSLEQYKVCYKRIMFLHWLRGTMSDMRIRSNRCEIGYINFTDMKSAEYLKNRTIDIIRNEKKTKAVKYNYVSKCPADNCMGMLDDNMTCKLCHTVVCKKCMDIIGIEGDKNLKNHVCDEATLASAKMIRKETKPCPKCSARIYKIEGCDQMWCTECNIPFSWANGNIIKGRVHNPHYFEWLKQNKDDRATLRAPTEILCGGLPMVRDYINRIALNPYFKSACYRVINNAAWELNEAFTCIVAPFYETADLGEQLFNWLSNFWMSLFRVAIHIQNSTLRKLRRDLLHVKDFKQETVHYTLNMLEEKKYKKLIVADKIKREKDQSVLDIYEMLSAVFNETIREVYNMIPDPNSQNPDFFTQCFGKLEEYYQRIINIVAYANQELVKCSVVHGRTVEYIAFRGIPVETYKNDTSTVLIVDFRTGITKKFLKRDIEEKQDENGKNLHWKCSYKSISPNGWIITNPQK